MKINGQERPEPNATLGDVMRILAERQADHEATQGSSQAALRAFHAAQATESAALLLLDKAQEDFNQRVEALKANAPIGSLWHRQQP